MLLKLLKGKLHRVTVTDSLLHYNGSIGIDENLLKAAGILNFEHVEVYNITNGERFTTYAIKEPKGSGKISIYGAAAHKAKKGDLLIICAYAFMDEKSAKKLKPKIVVFKKNNAVDKTKK